MNKAILFFSVACIMLGVAGYKFYRHRHRQQIQTVTVPLQTGAPRAVAYANGRDSLTIFLPCYTQKDNGQDAITLNGRRSSNAAQWLWTKISGPGGCIIFNKTGADTRVLKLQQGKYVFQLKITNDLNVSDSSSVIVLVKAAAPPAVITVDTIGNPGTNEELQYKNQSNKICYIRAGTYKSFYGNNLNNIQFRVKYRKAGDQVIIQSNNYYAFRISDGYACNITVDGSGVPGQPYGFKIIGPNTPDAVLAFHDSSRNRVIKNVEIQGGLATKTGSQGIGLHIYPVYPVPGKFDTTASHIGLSRQNGFTMGNDTIINCFIHGCLNEGIYEGPSHYGDHSLNGYTAFFTEAQADTFYFANNIIDSTGQSGMNVGAVAGLATIYNNKIYHFALRNQSGHTGGINANPGSYMHIYNNKIWNELPYTSETQGIAAQCVGGLIYNNELTGCQYAFIFLRNTDKNCGIQVPDVFVFNNTIVGAQYGYYVYSANYSPAGIHWKNNVVTGSIEYFGANGKDYSAMDTVANYYGPVSTAKFKNPIQRDYALLPGSPLAGTGLALTGFFKDDMNKSIRKTPWNKGAQQ